jgi:cytochrome P450
MNALSPASPIPAHIPPEAVYDFDMYLDPELLAAPHAKVEKLLREAPPVFWTPRNGGHWMCVGYEENFDASRDYETFSSELMARKDVAALMAMAPKDMPRIPQPAPINLDPPDHGKYKAPLLLAFSPKAMNARRDQIRDLANSLIDAVVERGSCEFITEIAEPLPVQVFLKLMGLPLERSAEFRDLVHEVLAPDNGVLMELARRLRKVADAIRGTILERQHDRRDDLISLLWGTEVDGKPASLEMLEDYGVLLFIAGLDTVINGIGHGIRHMAIDQRLQARLRADPSLIPEALEELLRRYTFTAPPRRLAKDTEFAGWTMKEGERFVLYLPGADLDSRKYEGADTVDLDRENKVHIAFGAGPHRCLGSHLARVELQIVYEQMLSRLPTFRIDETRPTTYHAGAIIAFDSLPLRWD